MFTRCARCVFREVRIELDLSLSYLNIAATHDRSQQHVCTLKTIPMMHSSLIDLN